MDKCKNCGAELTVDNTLVQKCSYCGSTYNLNAAALPENTGQHKIIEEIKPNRSATIVSRDVNNEVSADSKSAFDPDYWAPPPISPAARKFQLYSKSALVFLSLWVGLYFLRLNMPDGKTNLSQHHSLIFSPIGGDYWWIRGALLLGLFPLGVALLIYNTKYKNK